MRTDSHQSFRKEEMGKSFNKNPIDVLLHIIMMKQHLLIKKKLQLVLAYSIPLKDSEQLITFSVF